MDAYSITRLYHQALLRWWDESSDEERDAYRINSNDIAIESMFMAFFKCYPSHYTLLLASDGLLTYIQNSTDTTPPLFKQKRFMKIDNRTGISSIKNVVKVFYQLLSIDMTDITILDLIGLLQFLMSFQSENHMDLSGTELIKYIRKQLFNGPSFLTGYDWRKMIREPILSEFYDTDTKLERHETMLKRVDSCHKMIKTLCLTIDQMQERLDHMESYVISLKENN
jgi:hypothetical protein